MDINWGAVAAATVAQFIVGAVWYSALFGKVWGQIHGFDKLSPEKQKEMASKMGPWYGLQLLVTLFTAVVLAKLVAVLPGYSPYALAFMAWIGFVVPIQYGDVTFGGTESQWYAKKIAISLGGSLACLMVGAAVISLF